jgi:hypothetical protein
MKRTPRPQCFKDRTESLAVRTYPILYPTGWFLQYRTLYQAARFEFPQLLPQNLNRHSGHGPSKLAKTE